ncbi:major facilitator superfamily domain-containing protein [Flagelloscypha sp. PMI_526]|nr:major facilitator superfamily domain-containing protein [Flagelloscypha sp. PMI_526]
MSNAETTQDAETREPAPKLASFGRILPILCIHAFISARGYYGFYSGPLSPLVAAVLSIFMAPYWSYVGDIKGRKIPLLVSLTGGILGSLVTLFSYNTTTIVLSGIIIGITGGPVSFQGAALSYIVDVSPRKSLLPNLCIALAVQILSSTFIPWLWRIMRLSYVVLGIPLFLFIYYFLQESRPTPIALALEPEPSIRYISYQPLKWLKSVRSALRDNGSLLLAVVATSIMCLVDPFSLTFMLWWHSRDAYWFEIMVIAPNIARVVILMVFALVVSHLLERINRAELSKSFGLGSIANIVTTHLLSLIGFLLTIPAVMIIFNFLNTFSAPLFPALTLILYHVWSGEIENRGSAIGAFALLQSVFTDIGTLAAFIYLGSERPDDPRMVIISSGIACGIAVLAFLALKFVRVTFSDGPGRAEGEERAQEADVA